MVLAAETGLFQIKNGCGGLSSELLGKLRQEDCEFTVSKASPGSHRSAEQGQVFSVERGGLICGRCREKCTDGRTLLTSTLYTLQYIISSPVEKLYTFVVKEEVLEELGKLVTDYLARYLGKHFKSLEILETIMQ